MNDLTQLGCNEQLKPFISSFIPACEANFKLQRVVVFIRNRADNI
jgi:hypothetical protein